MANKPIVAFIELTCCAGCECALLDTNETLLELLARLDIRDFRLFEEHEKEPKVKMYDVVFVVGSPSTKEQVAEIKRLRKKTRVLIAYGGCAIYNSVWGSKRWRDKEALMRKVYPLPKGIDNLDYMGVKEVVPVDFEIPTCPVNANEFVRVVNDFLIGKIPVIPKRPVCYECQLAGYECVLQKGQPCLGPVTLGGCGAVCLKSQVACQACRGPLVGANFDSLWKKIVGLVGAKRAEQILEVFGVKEAFFEQFNVKKQ